MKNTAIPPAADAAMTIPMLTLMKAAPVDMTMPRRKKQRKATQAAAIPMTTMIMTAAARMTMENTAKTTDMNVDVVMTTNPMNTAMNMDALVGTIIAMPMNTNTAADVGMTMDMITITITDTTMDMTTTMTDADAATARKKKRPMTTAMIRNLQSTSRMKKTSCAPMKRSNSRNGGHLAISTMKA